MNVGFIIVLALGVLGVLAFLLKKWSRENRPHLKSVKKERPAPVLADKEDVSQVTLKFERRIRAVENLLQVAESQVKEKCGVIDQLNIKINLLEQQVIQEKAWRQKEESYVVKEREQEKVLENELEKTRNLLDVESGQRIRFEREIKDLRLAKDMAEGDVRRLTGQNNEFSRRLNELEAESRILKSENAKLKVKKEADAWVAKDDFVKLEKLLKRARFEVGELKKRLPEELRDIDKV